MYLPSFFIMGTEDNPRSEACLCLIHGIIEHGGIASQLLDTCLTIQLGIQSSLDHTESQRRTLHHDFSPLYTGILQLIERNHLVHHSHLLCLFCRILLAEEPDFTSLLLTYHSCQIRRTETGIEASYLRTGLTKDGIF